MPEPAASHKERIATRARESAATGHRVAVAVDVDDFIDVVPRALAGVESGARDKRGRTPGEDRDRRGGKEIAAMKTHGGKIARDREAKSPSASAEAAEKRGEDSVIGTDAGHRLVFDHSRRPGPADARVDHRKKKGVRREKRPVGGQKEPGGPGREGREIVGEVDERNPVRPLREHGVELTDVKAARTEVARNDEGATPAGFPDGT